MDKLTRYRGAMVGLAVGDAVGTTLEFKHADAEEVGYLLEAYLQMLSGSRLLRGVERRIAQDKINAEAAVQARHDAPSATNDAWTLFMSAPFRLMC